MECIHGIISKEIFGCDLGESNSKDMRISLIWPFKMRCRYCQLDSSSLESSLSVFSSLLISTKLLGTLAALSVFDLDMKVSLPKALPAWPPLLPLCCCWGVLAAGQLSA